MAWGDAIRAAAAQPVSDTAGLTLSTDTKKQEAMRNAGTLARGLYESAEAYQKRMQQWRAEHAKKIAAENTTTAERKYQEIAYQFSKNPTDPAMLQRQLGDMQSLFRFTTFNNLDNSFDNKLTLAKSQALLTEQKIYKLKNGQNDNRGTTNPMLYDGSFQDAGERDFLS